MKVKELIKQLSSLNPCVEIMIRTKQIEDDFGRESIEYSDYDINKINIDDNGFIFLEGGQ